MPAAHLSIRTAGRREILDITSRVAAAISGMEAGEGLCAISVAHCTCAVYINENEDGLVEDMLRLIGRITAEGPWQHDRIDRNADAHLAASLIGNAVIVALEGGLMQLGAWQRIMLVELDGPRARSVTVTVMRG